MAGRRLSDTSSIFSKSGDKNIISISVADRFQHYFNDICTTLIDIKWRWNLLIFFGGFLFFWLIFAAFYFMLAVMNGDLENPPPANWQKPCVINVNSFTSSFLFSIETMTTIGYGSRFVTEACPGAYLAVLIQSIVGAGLQLALAGLVVAKIRRAKKRSGTILFSREACMYEDDGELKLSVRVGDMRRSEITAAHVKGMLIQKLKSKHGTIPVTYLTINFKSENGTEQLFLPWPSYLIHHIDDKSPLWDVSRYDLDLEEFELIIMINGIASSTSMAFQAKKSYKPSDLKWGRRFHALGMTTEYEGEHYVDYEHFHDTYPILMTDCSAKDMTEGSIVPSLPSSTETTRKRKYSRTDSVTTCSSIFKRRQSITDTFLGPDFEDSDFETRSLDFESNEDY